jgi:hypothetical protein
MPERPECPNVRNGRRLESLTPGTHGPRHVRRPVRVEWRVRNVG